MFIRLKTSGPRQYLQIVENHWDKGKVRQQVIATLGRLDILKESGALDSLIRSGIRFSEKLALIDAYKKGNVPSAKDIKIGLPLVFGRLWQSTGIKAVLEEFLLGRKFKFPVERAIFLTVLHRLCISGSDRAAEKWRMDYQIEGTGDIGLHHLYRAMAWIGEELSEQGEASPFSTRCTKDLIEEKLFERRRDLFSDLTLVFFDTTTIYFEGQGGQEIGKRGNTKDHRPDLRQMVVGVVLDNKGSPICCELWPGNTADVKSLIPVADRLHKRFGIQRICIVADRGMISAETIKELEDDKRGMQYILGARMRRQKEVTEEVLSRAGRYREVYPKGTNSKDPSPLKVKDVIVNGRRYIVCYNEDQAKKDALDRKAIIASLQDKLKQGVKSLVGNKGYRRYLKTKGSTFQIDEEKIKGEARYDGKWVLRTNTKLTSEQTALQYKQLWMVEQIFRSVKSILNTRPIYHKCDETIKGHVFCSFLALILMKELQERLTDKGWNLEWADLINDLERVKKIEIKTADKHVLMRTELQGEAGKAFHAAGVAIPPTVRIINENSKHSTNSL